MRRITSFTFAGKLKENSTLLLPKEAKHHLLKVLRLRDGESLEVCDGRGKVANAILDGNSLVLSSIEKHEAAEPFCVVLALIKSDRFRFALEKLTELGVSEIRPLHTDRSQIKIPEKKFQERLNKWNAIVENAARQSKRAHAPLIHPPSDLLTISKLDYHHIVADPGADKKATINASNIAFWVGPEGGFSDEEFSHLKQFETFYLSDAILRSETAAIVGTVLLLPAR